MRFERASRAPAAAPSLGRTDDAVCPPARFGAADRARTEDNMPDAAQSFADMLRKFGSDLGLPKIDVDGLIETNRKNIDALARSADIAAQGARSAAVKQAQIVEASLREALDQARQFKPAGSPQEMLARQTEFARKTFDATVNNARELSDLVGKSNVDAFKVIGDRIAASVAEIRASLAPKAAKDKP
jgi:phasin family protein